MTQTVLLGDICDVRDGTHDSPKPKDSGHPLVTSKHIKNHKIDFSTANLISDEDFEAVNKRSKVDQHDILISMIGTVGELALIDYEPTFAIKNIGLIKTGDELLGKYLFYYLQSTKAKQYIEASLAGSTQKFIGLGQLRKFPVELPDIETQKKIADILGTIDEKIELNRQMNETLEQMGQALFRHYFIDNPEAEKWEEKTIGELCDVKIGRTPPRKESEWFDKNDGEAWVSIKDMGQGATFISDSSEYLTEDAVTKFNVPTIEPNTLLLSFKLTVGRLCISTKRMHSNEAIAQLPLRGSEVSIEYFYYFLRNFNYSQLSSTSSIATAVNSTTVKSIKVTVPTETVMKDFTAQAHDILEAVKNNEAEIQTLTTLRDTLLPRLISGKVKV